MELSKSKSLSTYEVNCEPVIDILSAKVVRDSEDTSFGVNCYITIQDFKGLNKSLIYQSPQSRESEESHLSCLKEIQSLNKPWLHVDICDYKSGRSLFCSQERFPKPKMLYSLDQFEMMDTLQFPFLDLEGEGGSGHLEVNYVTFTFGVYARVQIHLYKDDDDDNEKGVEVFGQIYAKCNPLILKDCYKNHIFNVIEKDHEWVGLGDEIVLNKDLLAVPAYSDLEISVDLNEDTGSFVKGTVFFESITMNRNPSKLIQGVKGYYVSVQVSLCEPSLLEEPPCCAEYTLIYSLPVCLPKQPMMEVSQLLEVFSLFIYCPIEVRLYGSVRIYDSRGSCDIFTCSRNEPYMLACGCNWLPLQGPNRAIIPKTFVWFEIDLSDISGDFKIQGYADSTFGVFEIPKPWFDRRFSSVVRGDGMNSFVAVNFTLFPFAVEATLTVRLFYFKSFKIYGNVTASYGELSYSTKYDSDFFQSVLFTRNKANSLEFTSNKANSLKIRKLKLSRCVVAVPMTSSLLTRVDLSFQSVEGTRHVRIRKNMRFMIGESSRVLKRGNVGIYIDVEWKGLPYV